MSALGGKEVRLLSLAKALEHLLVGEDDRTPSRAEVIAAIGETLAPDLYQPSPQTKRVAEVAAYLLRDGRAPAIAFIGRGYPPRVEARRSEAAAMREVASSIVDLAQYEVVMERESYDTRANGVALKEVMDAHGWKSAIVVAQQLHMKRVRDVFRKLMPEEEGYYIRVVAAWSPYGGSSKWIFRSFWTFLLWDRVIAWGVFRLKGWI